MRQSLVSSIRRYLLVLSGLTTTRILTSYILKRIGDDIPTLMAALHFVHHLPRVVIVSPQKGLSLGTVDGMSPVVRI